MITLFKKIEILKNFKEIKINEDYSISFKSSKTPYCLHLLYLIHLLLISESQLVFVYHLQLSYSLDSIY